jgi:hypothetical protein
MILKVPIYVEIDSVDPDSLSKFTEELSERLYKKIRSYDLIDLFGNLSTSRIKKETGINSLSILSKKQVLEELRTKK